VSQPKNNFDSQTVKKKPCLTTTVPAYLGEMYVFWKYIGKSSNLLTKEVNISDLYAWKVFVTAERILVTSKIYTKSSGANHVCICAKYKVYI